MYFAQGSEGLTCATFVAHVCLQAGVRLLDFKGWWHDWEDFQFQEEFIETTLPRHRPELVPQFKRDLGVYRFRPEDVCSSGLFDKHPVGFFRARYVGEKIMASARDYYARSGLA